MTQKETAAYLMVSIRTLQRFVRRGQLTPSYEPGKTRPVPLFDKAEVEALRATLYARPVYPQSQVPSAQPSKQPFGFRMAPEELERLRVEAVQYGMSISAYARQLVQMGLESALQQKLNALQTNIRSLQHQIEGFEQALDQFQQDFTDAIEIVLEFAGGMTRHEAKKWVDTNLRSETDAPAKSFAARRRR